MYYWEPIHSPGKHAFQNCTIREKDGQKASKSRDTVYIQGIYIYIYIYIYICVYIYIKAMYLAGPDRGRTYDFLKMLTRRRPGTPPWSSKDPVIEL